jgi:hypothetical protein
MITLNQLKSFLSISLTETSLDILLKSFIDSSISELNTLCARIFDHSSYTEIYSGSGGTTLVLNNYPVTTVTKIEFYDGESWIDIFRSPDTISDSALLLKEVGIIKLLRYYEFPKGEQNIRVLYAAGYKYADGWEPGRHYSISDTARYNNIIYTCNEDHTSVPLFDESKWDADPAKAVPESLAKAVMYIAAKQFYESPAGKNIFMKSSEQTGDRQVNFKDIDIERIIHTYRNTNV